MSRSYVASVKWTLRSPLKPKRGFTCQRHASPLADVRLCCVLGSDVTHSSTVSRYVSACACTLLDLPIKLCKSFFECLRGEAPTARDASTFNFSFARSPSSQVSHRVFEDAAPLWRHVSNGSAKFLSNPLQTLGPSISCELSRFLLLPGGGNFLKGLGGSTHRDSHILATRACQCGLFLENFYHFTRKHLRLRCATLINSLEFDTNSFLSCFLPLTILRRLWQSHNRQTRLDLGGSLEVFVCGSVGRGKPLRIVFDVINATFESTKNSISIQNLLSFPLELH